MSVQGKKRFKSSKNFGYVISYLLMKIKKEEIMIMSKKNIEVLTVILILNYIKKILQYFII